MHNNIMAAGSRDRPPMLATGRYAQWRSRFLRYIDTRQLVMPLREVAFLKVPTLQHEIYSTVDACQDRLKKWWEASERLQKEMTNRWTVWESEGSENVVGLETVGGPYRASGWLAGHGERLDEQELEAHYSYMAKIQEVPNADSGTDAEPLEQVQYDTDDNVFANDIQHFDQSESISNTCAVETDDSNVTPDSPDMCDNDIQDVQN
ncbi:hypothetical protein Tco_1310700 [Tanacetum coccineum]